MSTTDQGHGSVGEPPREQAVRPHGQLRPGAGEPARVTRPAVQARALLAALLLPPPRGGQQEPARDGQRAGCGCQRQSGQRQRGGRQRREGSHHCADVAQPHGEHHGAQ